MPTILPQTAFGFDAFGIPLTGYLEISGTRINISRSGFDNMVRRYMVNTDVTKLDPFNPGVADSEYPQMFSNRILTDRFIGGPWSSVEVEYLGVIGQKIHEISTDADTRKTSINIGYGLVIVNWQIEISEVTVQDVYIQNTMPDLNLTGTAVAGIGVVGQTGLRPPIDIPPPSIETLNMALGLPPGTLAIFSWYWALRRRALRIAGIPPSAAATRISLSGAITISNSTTSATGVSTRFLSELSPGLKIYPTTPPTQNELWTFGFTIANIQDDTHATLTSIPTFGFASTYTGQFYASSGVTVGNALYEVTDSWKRIVLLRGEPIANALAQ